MLKVAIVQEGACKNRQTQKMTYLWKSELKANCRERRKGTVWTCLAPDGKGRTPVRELPGWAALYPALSNQQQRPLWGKATCEMAAGSMP